MRSWVAVAIAALPVAACTSSPDPATANEPCSAYMASRDGTHRAVTRHIAAVLWGVMIDAAAPPGPPHVTPVKTLVNKVTPAQMSAAENVVTDACRIEPSSTAVYATVSATGAGKITVPDVFSAPDR